MSIKDIILLLGGVALFLFGMSLMGDGLKKVAGNKLELVLFRLSSTPLKGILLGTAVTGVIQSSAATSIMTVGFVNSGMMKLRQAVGVLMGAIIGTSVTGWVICLSSIGEGGSGALSLISTEVLSAVVAVVGVILYLFSKKANLKNIGLILMGFAVLMFGMKTMSGSVAGLKETPAFMDLLTNFSNPFLGILFGMIFTAILQSASAAVGILQALSATGVITFGVALPIIMGIVIGAAVPVLFSMIGAETDGKRTAVSLLLIKVLGVVLGGTVFYILNAIFEFPIMGNTVNTFNIALMNSCFRIGMIILLLPFITVIEKLATLIVRQKNKGSVEQKIFEKLDERFLDYPPLAVEQTRMVINSMAASTRKSLTEAVSLLKHYDEKVYKSVVELERVVDRYEDRIGSYLVKLTGRELMVEQNNAVSKYLHTVSDFERISDHARNIAESALEIHEKKIVFTDSCMRELEVLIAAITEIVSVAFGAFIGNRQEDAFRVEPLEELIDNLCDDIETHHVARLQKGTCTLEHGYVFNDLITNFERISDHCSNVAIAIIEEGSNQFLAHEYVHDRNSMKSHGYDEYYNEYFEKFHI